MATVIVVTADRTLEIEASSIVDGDINSDGHLVLLRHDGTPIDMGAVSGMKLNPGSGYSKVDAFSYIGPSDPGAVPNGSVWYDTNDVAGPFASDSQKGLVELATNAETVSGTDAQRAVTPASLAARLSSDAAASPGYKTQVLTANSVAESATPTSYPSGVSMLSLQAGSGWSLNAGYGMVITMSISTDRTIQEFHANAGGTVPPIKWMRAYNTSGGGWTSWVQISGPPNLNPASFTETTSVTSYPLGHSRIYFPTTASASSWGPGYLSPGEIVTHKSDANYCRQTFTKYATGSGNFTDIWHRTGNSSTGWSEWYIPATVNDINKMSKAEYSGSVVITPTTVNVAKSGAITFPGGWFSSAPYMQVTAILNNPSLVQVSVESITTSGANIWITRSTLTATTVHWRATLN